MARLPSNIWFQWVSETASKWLVTSWAWDQLGIAPSHSRNLQLPGGWFKVCIFKGEAGCPAKIPGWCVPAYFPGLGIPTWLFIRLILTQWNVDIYIYIYTVYIYIYLSLSVIMCIYIIPGDKLGSRMNPIFIVVIILTCLSPPHSLVQKMLVALTHGLSTQKGGNVGCFRPCMYLDKFFIQIGEIERRRPHHFLWQKLWRFIWLPAISPLNQALSLKPTPNECIAKRPHRTTIFLCHLRARSARLLFEILELCKWHVPNEWPLSDTYRSNATPKIKRSNTKVSFLWLSCWLSSVEHIQMGWSSMEGSSCWGPCLLEGHYSCQTCLTISCVHVESWMPFNSKCVFAGRHMPSTERRRGHY